MNKDPPVVVGEPTNEVLVEIFRKIGSKENSRTVSEIHRYYSERFRTKLK